MGVSFWTSILVQCLTLLVLYPVYNHHHFRATTLDQSKIQNLKSSDRPCPQMLGKEISDERTVPKGHVIADVIAAFE
jgi:hypothetical protein